MNSIYIEVTHKCNLNCLHCYNMSAYDDEEMDKKIYERIIRDIAENQNEEWNVAISGGEPLTHSKIKDILRSTQNFPNVHTTLVTNGILLEEIEEEFLVNKNPISIQISLDGASKEVDDMIRGNGHFEKTTRIIERLAKKKYGLGMLRMTLSQVNYEEIEDFVEFSIENSFIPSFSFLNRIGNAAVNWSSLLLPIEKKVSALNTIRSVLCKNKERFANRGIYLDISKVVPPISYSCPLLLEDKPLSVAIKSNGEVQPCQALYDSFFSIGNVSKDSINDILDRKKNHKLRTLISFFDSRKEMLKDARCGECIIKDSCGTGCPAQALSDSDSVMELDKYCTVRRSLFYSKIAQKMENRLQ